jgi:hypothetical protein
VAVDGIWERAARVTPGASDDEVARLLAPLRARGEYAVEAFACDDSGHLAFCGVRFDDAPRADAEALLRALCAVARGGAQLGTVVCWLSEHAGPGLFDTACTAAEVGVVDAWKSCGAIPVFPVKQEQASLDPSRTLFSAARRISAPPGSIIAAEFASEAPRGHWVAVEIARVEADGGVAPCPPIESAAEFLATLL